MPKKEYREGVWENIFQSPTYGAKYKCSICGYVAREKYNFCPDCGAKMDRETKTDTDFPKDYSYGY